MKIDYYLENDAVGLLDSYFNGAKVDTMRDLLLEEILNNSEEFFEEATNLSLKEHSDQEISDLIKDVQYKNCSIDRHGIIRINIEVDLDDELIKNFQPKDEIEL